MKEVYKNYITVTWDAPESDGGAPITGYTVERRDIKRSAFVGVGDTDADTMDMKATKLTEGNEYIFRVCAQNEIGTSDFVTMDEAVMAKLPFGEWFWIILPVSNLSCFHDL